LVKAYVLLTTEVGCEEEISRNIKAIPEVRDAYILHGVYDLIIDIETDDVNYIKEIIHKKIRSMEKIRSTITMIERPNLQEAFQ
jgi:DNA-binding Lrp family transcriptional regulator